MKWVVPLLLTAILTPLAAAQNNEPSLVTHTERKNGSYLVLKLITQQIEVVPTESLDQCEIIGREIMKGGKLSKFLKGYECLPGFF